MRLKQLLESTLPGDNLIYQSAIKKLLDMQFAMISLASDLDQNALYRYSSKLMDAIEHMGDSASKIYGMPSINSIKKDHRYTNFRIEKGDLKALGFVYNKALNQLEQNDMQILADFMIRNFASRSELQSKIRRVV